MQARPLPIQAKTRHKNALYILPHNSRRKIEKNKEIVKAEFCALGRNLFAAVCSVVADFSYKVHAAADILADNVAEILRVHKADEVVLIGNDERVVHGIHPLYGKLHRPAAVEHAGV